MYTLYLGLEEVDAYLRDLAARFLALGDRRPAVWCTIGPSGAAIAQRLLNVAPALVDGTRIAPVNFDRRTREVTFEFDESAEIAGEHVLILDSSVHSGTTMHRIVRRVQEFDPASLSSYTLVLKRSSTFVPTHWGLMIGDYDRAYFLLDKLPNNRLNPKSPDCHFRRLTDDDLDSAPVVSGVDSIDRVTWADRWYDMRSSERERRTYLLESGKDLVGFVTFVTTADGTTLLVDEVVVDERFQGGGYGSALMRWAETMARQLRCSELRLWAIDDQVSFYERLGYEPTGQGDQMNLEGHTYELMRKKIIYHI